MSKIKLYVYPNAGPMLHESPGEVAHGFSNTIPFSPKGIADHCELVPPEQADYFYMGQVADKDSWLLHPNRFKYFDCNEHRHIVDLEGDWRDFDHPDWLKNSIITTGHARLSSLDKFKLRFVRPVMSPLLMRLVKNLPKYEPPAKNGFQFQGQRDGKGLREKLYASLQASVMPHEFAFTNSWGCYLEENHPFVVSYLNLARKWSIALCPYGEGPTCRFYEMVFLGRMLVLIADYQVFAEHKMMTGLVVRIATDDSVNVMASRLCYTYQNYSADEYSEVLDYRDELLVYFKDPTAYLLNWLSERAN